MALQDNIMKVLNVEQITPDPVMADPEFCLCGWCTQRAVLSSFVYVYSADYQPAFSVYLCAVTLKTGLGVREGHWKGHHSI